MPSYVSIDKLIILKRHKNLHIELITMNRPVNLKKYLLTIIVVWILAFTMASVVFSSSSEIGIEPKSFITEASYIVGIDGSDTYMKNGDTGEIDWESTNSSVVISACIGNSTDGGWVFIMQGTYELSGFINDGERDDITLSGEGRSTILKQADGANLDYMIYVFQQEGWVIKDLQVDGNRDAQSGGGQGVKYYYTHNSVMKNLYVHHTRGSGIYVRLSNDVWVVENEVAYCTPAIEVSEDSLRTHVITNKAHHSIGNGGIIVWDGSNQSIISENICWLNGHSGLAVSGVSRCIISNNEGFSNGRLGLWSGTSGDYDFTRNIISSNHFYNNTWSGISLSANSTNNDLSSNTCEGNTVSGIRFEGYSHNNTVLGGRCSNNMEYGVHIPTHCNDTVIKNIFLSGNSLGEILNDGSGSIIKFNEGFVTENSGTSESSNDDYIAHGLAGEPTYVDLTIEETDANYFLQFKATNVTHFQIYLEFANETACSDDKTINWYAVYEP